MNRAKKKKVTHPTAEPADDPMETTVSVAEPPQQPPPAPEPPPPSELVCAEEADDSDGAQMKSARAFAMIIWAPRGLGGESHQTKICKIMTSGRICATSQTPTRAVEEEEAAATHR